MIKRLALFVLCIFAWILPASCSSQADTQQALIDPVEKRCVQTVPIEELSPDISDILLMRSADHRFLYRSDLLNRNREQVHFESGLTPFDILISPDRKLAAITMLTTDHLRQMPKLLLMDAAGAVQKEFTWRSEWGPMAAWLDDHRILIATQADFQLSIYNATSIILLDIDNGQEVEVQSAYPDLNQADNVSWNLINHFYSPDFTRVLYLASRVDPVYINYVALRNLENKQVLATLPIELGETSTPQWSPDGSQILISGLVAKLGEKSNDWRGQELFTIDANGKITQRTHFTNYYPGRVIIQEYAWSPDGQRVAFWLQTERMNKPELVTLNLSTGEAVNHCISDLIVHADTDLIWLSSSDYLLITRHDSLDAAFQTLLMNDAQNVVTQIGENALPVGWMVSAEK